MAKFKIGDVVRLKSGGDAMTVVDVAPCGEDSVDYRDRRVPRAEPSPLKANEDRDQVFCCWFPAVYAGGSLCGYTGELKRESFDAVLLEACPRPSAMDR